jgi:hypothetical protein
VKERAESSSDECSATPLQIMKQGVNSAVRFSSYSTLSQLAIDWTAPESGRLSSVATFGVGAIAGLITVCESRFIAVICSSSVAGVDPLPVDSTMPLDTIKTRMQSLEARSNYKNSFHCLQRVSQRCNEVSRLLLIATPTDPHRGGSASTVGWYDTSTCEVDSEWASVYALCLTCCS